VLKRLIEVALPLKEVSEQSAREKSIRHGHISTLHIWWARRPLAACRAAVFASLIPDPDDPECPESFRKLVTEVLGRAEFRPKLLEPSPAAARLVPREEVSVVRYDDWFGGLAQGGGIVSKRRGGRTWSR
jgi:adenine-specific DNA methylase